jgi:tetratricopeptide (TPR) repeat protein
MGRRRAARLAALALGVLSGCVSLAPRSRTPSPEARVVPGIPLTVFDQDRCGPGSLSLALRAHGEAVSARDLETALPEKPGRGVLSVDLLLAARGRGFDAALVTGTAEAVRGELAEGRPAILMLRLLDAPGERRDVYHYVVVDGFDPARGLFRFQFGDGKARWARLESLEGSWKPAGHALLVIRSRADTDAALARAVALEGEGRLQEADALYRQVLVVRPKSVRAWVNLGNVAADQRRREDSETAYRRALEVAPDDRDALNNLAWLLLAEGTRLEEAETLATRAANQPGPDRPLAQDTLGRIQLARGLCAQAARTFREALEAEAVPEKACAGLRDGLTRAEECRRR